MNDYISRQAAIDAIENAFDRETILTRFVRKVAISAVRLLPSAEPKKVQLSEEDATFDYISRNAVIAKLNKMDRYISEELTYCDTGRKFPKNEVFVVDDVYEEIVEQLPSAQPEPKQGHYIGESDGYSDGEPVYDMWYCSECDYYFEECDEKPTYKFCYNCGVRLQ